jgi:phytoene/squalene synthetase
MRPFSAYQERLDAVSRSFALCIPQLAPPFRDQVALAYLLLRVLDTVEDAPFADRGEQARQFERLLGLLRAPPAAAEVDAFVARFPAMLTEAERALLGDTSALLADAHGLPTPARMAVFGAIRRMAAGMAAYARRGAVLRLVDLEDVSRYCCFVAGLVGELLTRLWALGHPEATPPRLVLAYHFGLFLQKVNILKDQREDEAAGRFFVPDRAGLVASLRVHGAGALAYLTALPPSERGYRIFCAWSLMMGAMTVAQAGEHKHSRRAETAALLARTAAIAQDDEALRRLYGELMPALPEPAPMAPVPKPEPLGWFCEQLGAPLSDAELGWLGVAVRSEAA